MKTNEKQSVKQMRAEKKTSETRVKTSRKQMRKHAENREENDRKQRRKRRHRCRSTLGLGEEALGLLSAPLRLVRLRDDALSLQPI